MLSVRLPPEVDDAAMAEVAGGYVADGRPHQVGAVVDGRGRAGDQSAAGGAQAADPRAPEVTHAAGGEIQLHGVRAADVQAAVYATAA